MIKPGYMGSQDRLQDLEKCVFKLGGAVEQVGKTVEQLIEPTKQATEAIKNLGLQIEEKHNPFQLFELFDEF